jgi:hypothetical protein
MRSIPVPHLAQLFPQADRRLATVLLLLSSAALAGCGKTDPFSYVEVKGTVKYEDESLIPAYRVTVTFETLEEGLDPKTKPRPGGAEVMKDGTFQDVTSSPSAIGEGIVPGRYKVMLRAFDEEEKQLDVIPLEYSDFSTTPIEIDTNEKTEFEFRVPKPQN